MPLLQNQMGGPAPTPSVLPQTSYQEESFFKYALIAFIVALVGVGVLGYRLLSLQSSLKDQTSQRQQLEAQYASLGDVKRRVADVQMIAKGLEVAYAAQSPIADLINVIEKTSYKPVKYQSVSVDKLGEVRLVGIVPSYQEFAKSLKAFKEGVDNTKPVTDTIKVDSVSQNSAGTAENRTVETKFSVSFKMKPTVLGKTEATTSSATSTNPTTNQ